MSQEIEKRSVQELDGFDIPDGGIEGHDGEQSIIQGTRIKFGNAKQPTTWMKADGTPLPSEAKFVAVSLLRAVQKWPPGSDEGPPETRILTQGEKFPDTDKLNAETPRAEWRLDPGGELKGPFENAYALYLLDPATMARLTYMANTHGGKRAVRILRDQITDMRRFRGKHVYAEVMLSDTFMPTQYGGRQRPHFEISRWVTFGGNGDVLPETDSPALPEPKAVKKPSEMNPTTASARAALRGLKSIAEPGLGEEMDDKIPW
jgi:hypothetical protein